MTTTGETVVLLHSGGMSARQWKKLNESLSTTHRVLAPDFLGAGENPPWPADREFAWAEDVAVIEELVTDLNAPVHLVGHSYGGLVAVTLARKHPELVASLTAYDPVAFGVVYGANDAAGLKDLARVGDNALFHDTERGGNEEWLEAFIDYWNVPGAWKAMAPQGQDAFRRVGRKVFWEVYSLMKDRTPASAYASVTAPSLFLTGEHTPGGAQAVVRILAAALPNGKAERIAGAGHMGPITHAAAVNERIVAHIRHAAR